MPNPFKLNGFPRFAALRITKTAGIASAKEPVGTVYTGALVNPIEHRLPISFAYNLGKDWLRTSPVRTIAHGTNHSTVRTMHSAYRVEAL